MGKKVIQKGFRYVDKKGMVWEILESPSDESKTVKTLSITKEQELNVPRKIIKSDWRRINY